MSDGRSLSEILDEWFSSADPDKGYPQTDPQVAKSDDPDYLLYTTLVCSVCGRADVLKLHKVAYQAWKGGAHIQDAFPDLTAGQREQLKTGYHDKCFDEIFAGSEDDAEDDECRCGTPCHEADVGIGVIDCMPQHCPVHGAPTGGIE